MAEKDRIAQKIIINNDELFGKVVEILRTGRQVTIPVKGYSMLPFIRGEKDLVVLEGICGGSGEKSIGGTSAAMGDSKIYGGLENRADAAKEQEGVLRRGDIVLFHCAGRYILHRVLSVRNGIAEIQGDGVYMNKEHCDLEHIYGRAVKILRGGEKAVDPDSSWQRLLVRCWWMLLPVRRYLLAIYRRLPWNRDL